MKEIKLIYWNVKPNFGDVLSPFIIGNLSGCKIRHKNQYWGWWKFMRLFCYNLIHRLWHEMQELTFPYERVMLGVGSIAHFGNNNADVWGSGYMNHFNKCRKGQRVYCLRGPKSYQKMKSNGINPPEAMGDPALLLPHIIEPKLTRKLHKIGIIPHIMDYEFFKSNYGDVFFVIDLSTDNIQKVVDDIVSCEYILSTSLHGLIVPHAYGIPAIWIKKGYIYTDGFKFEDYFLSVGLEAYRGEDNIDMILKSEESVLKFFEQRDKYSLPNTKIIAERCMDLLTSFPYPLVPKYELLKRKIESSLR